ncbi:serine/threonine-protein kinase fused-like [Rhagoletis pomonella]|uniref:serine/threonine-protein kinase fused-like n=1 Tax=Rhagoletis pomonella TaxID=28610 RepID=UPI0017870E90|nr:serine/threonine-protein kinase fused-like [Rhagoletis pomonella]
MNRYTVNSLIGEGSFGRVYKAIRKEDAQVVAIKVISKRGRSSRELKNLRRECEIQAHLKHTNVIEMLESFETKNDLIVVTEFAPIDLHRYLARHGAVPEDKAQRLICHLVSALYYLHSNRILHRDLKPQNVLLNEDLHAKLCDFGLARNMTMGTHVLTSIKGTPLYMAPELLAEQPYDHQADLWSLGCISYECLAGAPPFCTTSILHLVKLIKHEEVKWPTFLSSDCRSFLQGLLEKDPSLRISWTEILCHQFVEGKLFISGIKANNSPFTNPQKQKISRCSRSQRSKTDDISKQVASMSLANASLCTNENMTSSRDSINAIPPSDIENLETDVEENINNVTVPFADQSYKNTSVIKNHDVDIIIPHFNIVTEAAAAAPVINSQTCFVSGNTNMILNHMNDNFMYAANTNSSPPHHQPHQQSKKSPTESTKLQETPLVTNTNVKASRSKDLEKRKLSQNLDNFSLRLGQGFDSEPRKTVERRDKDKDKEKEQKCNKSIMHSADEKRSTGNSPPCLLPGWDSCDESQSPPIENDEWLAFLNRTMQEVLDGEMDSLKQHNLVSIIVAPLRNSKAIPKVVDSVAQLLSLPFVSDESPCVIELIQNVYIDVKLVPNLMYASKLLIYHKGTGDSSASLTHSHGGRAVRSMAELNCEEIRTISRLYELICHLVHLKQQFLSQFCDAVAILAANELLINLLQHDFRNANAVRISTNILGLLICVLRELPENADLVEKVIFNSKLNMVALLGNADDLIRMRMCMLFRLLARFSLRGLQSVWCTDIKKAIEELADDDNLELREIAESTLEELRHFTFYG